MLCNTWYDCSEYYTVKVMQNRDSRGQYINKSDSNRLVRSIRVTDEIWEKFGEMAAQRSITRADLLEEIVEFDSVVDNSRVVAVLQEALKLKANAGGAIKKKIKEVLLVLSK